MTSSSGKLTLLAGASSAIAASLCCLGPLILFSLGIGSSWATSLSVLEPYRPALMSLSLLFLMLAFRKVHARPDTCAQGTICADSHQRIRRQRIYWLTAIPALIIMALPWLMTLSC